MVMGAFGKGRAQQHALGQCAYHQRPQASPDCPATMARLTLLNLETALCVERIGTFSGAARRLNASQSAISLRIRELESSLGFKLFARRGQQMLPTPEGREFLDRVEPLVRELEMAVTWLARLLDAQLQNAANFRYEITIERVPTLIVLLEQEKIDLGLLPTPYEHPKFDCIALGSEPMLWLMAQQRIERFADYPKRAPAALADVLNRGPLWLPHRSSPYFLKQTEVLRRHGAHLRNVNVCTDILRMADLVAHTGGLGYLPESLVSHRLASGELVPVPGLEPGEAAFYAVKRRMDQRPILQRLIELTHKEGARGAAR
jgi:DNA-binding transcriptional LysR family regulator